MTEVLQGFKRDKDMARARDLLLAFSYFEPQPPEDYLAAATLYRACRRKGFTVRKTVDCLIAQIALRHGLELLQRDGDFDLIAQVYPLKIYTP